MMVKMEFSEEELLTYPQIKQFLIEKIAILINQVRYVRTGLCIAQLALMKRRVIMTDFLKNFRRYF